MEANESSGLTTSYTTYQSTPRHHQQQNQNQPPPPPPSPPQPSQSNTNGDGSVAAMYPQTVSGKAPSIEPSRRKRGRPRKYDSPEAAAAAKRAALPAKRKEQQLLLQQQQQQQQQLFGGGSGVTCHSSSGESKKTDVSSFGGQGFTPHIINVAAGEDVGQKVILFMQQTKRELCILSASGSIASAALRQPATSGGNIAYQGRFDIISLTGSYVRSDLGGKAGGLSACLAAENGQIVGGGVCGPLIAAGPVEVIVATFLVNPKRDTSGGFKSDILGSTMASPVSAPPASYRPVLESSGGFRLTVNDDHQNVDGNAFIMQSQWRSGLNYDLTGHDSHDSPENGDYEHLPD